MEKWQLFIWLKTLKIIVSYTDVKNLLKLNLKNKIDILTLV